MGNAEKVYKNICRICLSYYNDGNMVSLTDRNEQDGLSCYGKSVVTFADISIKSDHSLPSEMCINCLNLLKNAIRFKFLSESSDKQLRSIKSLTKESEQFEQHFKEKVIEYTTFISYFPTEPFKGMASKKTVSDTTSTNGTDVSYHEIEADSSFHEDFETMHSDEDISEEGNNILSRLEVLVNRNSTLLNTEFKRNYRISRKYKLNGKTNRIHFRTRMKNIKCSVCNKVLANPSTYEQHMQMHNGHRFMCEHCGKGFAAKAALQIHQVAKHGAGSHMQCQHCNFKTAKRFDLIEHIRIHTGERPFACDKCGLTFRRRNIWKKHLICHSEKTVQCPHCPRKFFKRSDMMAHTNGVHERMYVFLCSKCGVTYAKIATVRRHLTEKHGIPREMQGKVTRINKGLSSSFNDR